MDHENDLEVPHGLFFFLIKPLRCTPIELNIQFVVVWNHAI